MGLGLQGAYGAAGGQDELQQLVAQRIKETLLKQAEEQRLFENQRALNTEDFRERSFGEDTRRFDTTHGENVRQFDANFGQQQTQWADMAPQRDANVDNTLAQTWNIRRQPEAEATQRAHESGLVDQRGRWNLREIGAQGEESRRTLAARPQTGQPTTGGQSPYMQERNTRNLDSVRRLMERVSGWTTGAGSMLAGIPATDARDFAADLDMLKANIAFGELTAMREASKTGGALGAVSEKELKLLESALGALDTGQSPENFRRNLQQIADSIMRYQEAAQMYGGNGQTSAQVNPQNLGAMDVPGAANADPLGLFGGR